MAKDETTQDSVIEYHRERLPPQVSKHLNPIQPWIEINSGRSGDSTYQVTLTDGADGDCAYLKVLYGLAPDPFANELDVMNYLNGKVPVPRLIEIGQNEHHHFMLIIRIIGSNAANLVGQMPAEDIVRIMAESLKQFHSIDIKNCPLDQRVDKKVQKALLNAKNQLVRLDDLDACRRGWSLEKLTSELKEKFQEILPLAEDLVFTHGDYCLPNVIINENTFSGFVDLGRAGIADRHQDIALALRSIQSNFKSSHEDLFLKHYELVAELNQDLIGFYNLLDEFF